MYKRLFHHSFQPLIRFAVIGVLTFSLTLGWAIAGWTPPALSQLPDLATGTSTDPLNPPSGVTRHGEYETAPIRSPLDNEVLFEVTSPTIFNRDQISEEQLPVEVRAHEINERLWRVFERTIHAKQTPTVTIATLNNRPIVQISDDQSSRPIRLVTVTEPDSDFNGKTLEELAQDWQTRVQAEIIRFEGFITPEVLRQRLGYALQILLVLVILSVVIWLLRQVLTHRQKTLEARYQQQLAAIAAAEKAQVSKAEAFETIDGETVETRESVGWGSRLLMALQQQFSVKRRLDIDKFLKWMLFWTFIGMWYIGIYRIISTIPLLMRWSRYVLATPLTLLAIWFGISLAIRISKSAIDRFTHSWQTNPFLPFGQVQRIALRSMTIAEALKGLVTVVLVSVGIVWTLNLFHISTTSILAGGAVIGLAISFGSQSLVKDLVNGCLILIEDQFAVGDVIQIDGQGGLVENLNLRVTQLRDGEGQLITIPNSTITNVRNLTRLWSRVDFSIVVAYENDPKQVLDVLRQVSEQLYNEPEWRDRLPEPPDVLGIDDLSHTGMLVRVWIKTAPMEQWSVGREFRLRVRQAFEANQIQIGRPQYITYQTDPALNKSAHHE